MHIKTSSLFHVTYSPESMPDSPLPQIAFAGRSNVGKSTLINALLKRKSLALTSSTPGKTRNIYFYEVNGSFLFADLPGYGYAQIPQGQRRFFRVMVDRFFQQDGNPRGCVLLIDPRRPVESEELDFLNFLGIHQIPFLVAMTKWDRVRPAQRTALRRARETELVGSTKNIVCVGARGGEGVADLWTHLEHWLAAAVPAQD